MIGRLVGEIITKKPPQILLDVNGVGYEVEAPMTTFYELPDVGSKVILLTHMVVREDAQLLYGFASENERSMFRHLIRINGVGPKLALTILSGISASELARCINEHDVTGLVKLPGVGKKTAERLIVELVDRIKDFVPNAEVNESGSTAKDQLVVENASSEAEYALIALGYKPQEASRMIRNIDTKNRTSEDIIRLALQSVVAGKK